MVKQTRRSFVGSAAGAVAGAAAATTLGSAVAGAAPAAGASAAISAQDNRQKITFYHIYGTPPGGTPAAKAPARRPICGNGASDASLRWRGFPSNYVAIAGPCRAVTRTSSRPLFPAQRARAAHV